MDGGDVAAVASIEKSASSAWNEQQIARELQRNTGLVLVAVSPDDVAQAWCCGVQTAEDAELLKITVSPKMQRMGLGESLLQSFCTDCAKKGVQKVFLEVRSKNYPALNLYAKHGFQEIGRRKNYYKKPVDDAIMCARRLNNDSE